MSWDADLTCTSCGHTIGDFNFTHNTNRVIAEAMVAAGMRAPEPCGGSLGAVIGPAWWDVLDGMTGPKGAEFLDEIIEQLELEPGKYDAMNPVNGWGSRESLVTVLSEMRDAVPEYPTTWSVNG